MRDHEVLTSAQIEVQTSSGDPYFKFYRRARAANLRGVDVADFRLYRYWLPDGELRGISIIPS